MLQANASLTDLRLGANAVNSRGLCALAHAAALHPALRRLALWGNRFDSSACLAWQPVLAAGKLELDFGAQEVDGVFMPVRR